MQSIVLVFWFWIISVGFVGSKRLVSQIDGMCKCNNIDTAQYDEEEFRSAPQYRIQNGTVVRSPDLPWAAALYLRFCGNETERPACERPEHYHFRSLCSAVLVSSRFVITVGHVCAFLFLIFLY